MDGLISQQSVNSSGAVLATPSKSTSSPETQPSSSGRPSVPASRSSKQITRNRVSYSCHACRRRKVKCDKVHPVCGQCVKTGCECVFDNSQTFGGSAGIAGISSNDAGKSGSPKDGNALAHQSQGDPIVELGLGHKRRRISDYPNEDYILPTRGFTNQPGSFPKAFDLRPSLTPSRAGPDDIETRLSRLSEIVGRYTSGPAVGYNTVEPPFNPQVSVWTPGENLSPESTSETSARDSFHRRSTSESVSSASRSARIRTKEIKPHDGMYTSSSSSESEDPARKAYSKAKSSKGGNVSLEGYIFKQSVDHVSIKETSTESGEASVLPSAGRNERLLQTKEPSSLGSPKESQPASHPVSQQLQQLVSDPVGDLAIGHLSLEEGGQSRYISNTFWAYVGNEISELNNLLREQSRSIPASPPIVVHEEATCSSMRDMIDSQLHPPPYHGTADGSSGDANLSKVSAESQATNNYPIGSGRLEATIAQNLESSQSNLHAVHAGNHPTEDAKFNSNPMHDEVIDKANFLRMEFPDEKTRFFGMLPDILKELPTREQCRVLYRGFMTGIHPVIPLIHPPRFHEDYVEFWDLMKNRPYKGNNLCPESILGRNPSFLPLILAVLYGGSISLSPKELSVVFGSTPKADLNQKLYNATTKALGFVSFPRTSTILSLSAFLIVQTLLIREEQPLASCMFTGLAMRVAQTMGLHRDGSHFNIHPIEAEVRRRVWWHIVHMDVMTALASGLPPLLQGDGLADTRPISELKDEYIGTPEGIEYERAVAEGRRSPDTPDDPIVGTKTSMTAVCYVLAAGRYVESTIVRSLLGKILGVKPLSSKDMQDMGDMLSELRTKMDERIGRIPTRGLPEMGFTPEMDAEFDLPPRDSEKAGTHGEPSAGDNDWQLRCDEEKLIAFHAWSRIVLSLLVDKAFGVIYQPVLKNAKSKIWTQARQCPLRHCHSFLRKFIHLSTARVFLPFRWCYPGMYQPMHATMILLVDLYERPLTPEAPRSRVFIDEIFSLFGEDGGISSNEDGVTIQRPLREGGREAWRMLGRLRRKAWEKAGLDPDVLWTEARQRQFEMEKPLTPKEKMIRQMREGTLSNAPIVNGSMTPKEQRRNVARSVQNSTQKTVPQAGLPYGIFGEPTEQIGLNGDITVDSPKHPSTAPYTAGPSQVPLPTHDSAMFENNECLNNYVENLTEALFEGPTPRQTEILYSGSAAAAAASALSAPPPPAPNPAMVATEQPGQMRNTIPKQEPELMPLPEKRPSLDEMDIKADFDWEEWDAVFGKYVSLDDMMDLDAETTDFSHVW